MWAVLFWVNKGVGWRVWGLAHRVRRLREDFHDWLINTINPMFSGRDLGARIGGA